MRGERSGAAARIAAMIFAGHASSPATATTPSTSPCTASTASTPLSRRARSRARPGCASSTSEGLTRTTSAWTGGAPSSTPDVRASTTTMSGWSATNRSTMSACRSGRSETRTRMTSLLGATPAILWRRGWRLASTRGAYLRAPGSSARRCPLGRSSRTSWRVDRRWIRRSAVRGVVPGGPQHRGGVALVGASSFSRMLCTWFFTVGSWIVSRVAICLLDSPSWSSAATSSSRVVRRERGPEVPRSGPIAARRRSRIPATCGGQRKSPCAASVIRVTRSSSEVLSVT